MAEQEHPTIYQGQDVRLRVTLDPVEEDISGWHTRLTIKERASDSVALLAVDGTITDGAAGEFECPLTHAETLGLQPGIYAYDIWRTDAGFECPLTIGKLIVKRDVRYP
jgi:hypothetical protein